MLIEFVPSPYFVTTYMLVVEKVVRGDRTDIDNVFRQQMVILNLPGLDRYHPSLPWIYKSPEDDSIATDEIQYIDDGRPAANTI